MPWVRGGDTSATYPRVLAVQALPDAPGGAVPMMLGFLFALGASSAEHLTDYIVTEGVIRSAGYDQHEWLLRAALKTGLLTKTRYKVHGVPAYKLIDDPTFLHVRLKAEVEWENQQRSDTQDLRIAVPVRERDGDLCRYCGIIVHWMGRKSPRKATLDHLTPTDADGNRPPATVPTIVVACLSCNSAARDAAGEDRAPLRPAPAVPFYAPGTATWLTKNGRPTLPTAAPDSDPHTAGTAQAPTSTATRHARTPREVKPDSDPARPDPARAPVAAESHRVDLTDQVEDRDSAGTGRVGTGQQYRSTTNPPNGRRRRRSARGRGIPT